MPEVSVIMPVFNKADYLAISIPSILVQDFQDFELIIINDGSTDLSLSIINSFSKSDSRIRVIDIPNAGVSNARNLGLEVSSGNYITFVDADDHVAPEYISNLYSLLCNNHVDMVISGVKKYWNDQSATVDVVGRLQGLVSKNELLSSFAVEQKETGIYGICVSKMFPRSLVSHIRFDNRLKLAEDFDFYLRLYNLIDSVYIDNKLYYFYLQEANNSSVKVQDADIDYFSQFKLDIVYRDFLICNGHYNHLNQKIIDYQLSNHLFLSLHYCSNHLFQERCSSLHEICAKNNVLYYGDTRWKRIILFLFQKKLFFLVEALTTVYHFARKQLGGFR